MSDDHGAGYGNRHQRVHIQIAILESNPAFLVSGQPAGDYRKQRKSDDSPVIAVVDPVDDLGQRSGHSGKRQRPPFGLG